MNVAAYYFYALLVGGVLLAVVVASEDRRMTGWIYGLGMAVAPCVALYSIVGFGRRSSPRDVRIPIATFSIAIATLCVAATGTQIAENPKLDEWKFPAALGTALLVPLLMHWAVWLFNARWPGEPSISGGRLQLSRSGAGEVAGLMAIAPLAAFVPYDYLVWPCLVGTMAIATFRLYRSLSIVEI